MHEFGHAFACRQTGGQADTIVLWPLGGVAFVKPPPRARAYLWSIAAGPLVNVILFPLLFFFTVAVVSLHWRTVHPDFYNFVITVFYINGVLLLFDLIPVYPLDGGQIVRGLLWFKVGPIRSLKAASMIGFGGAILFGLWALAAIHLVRHTRFLHFRAGASRLARCTEPRHGIRGGCSPRRRTFAAAYSRATTLSQASSRCCE